MRIIKFHTVDRVKNIQGYGKGKGRLGRRDHDNEKRHDLPVERVSPGGILREGHEVEAGGVQEQFDSHQDSDRAAPGDDDQQAQPEDDGAYHQVI